MKTMKNFKRFLRTLFFLTLGGILAAIAIEIFLVPNNIIDGGILGIAIMTDYIARQRGGIDLSLGFFTFVFNLPFIFFALKKFGTSFILSAFYAIGVMSLAIAFIESVESVSEATKQPILACLFGGLILGAGVGLVLRHNGCLDGTEILSIEVSKKIGFSVGEIVMFCNVFIFSAAGFVYGWDNAMFSMVTYYIAYHVIDLVLEGLNESKSIWIIPELVIIDCLQNTDNWVLHSDF